MNSNQAAWHLPLLFAGSWLPALLGYRAVAQVSGLYQLGAVNNPYYQPSHFWLLYVVCPLVTASSLSLFLSPGAIWTLLLDRVRSVSEWVILSFGASLLLCVLLGTGVKVVLGPPLSATMLITIWFGAAIIGLLVLSFRLRKRGEIAWLLSQWTERRRLLWMLATSLFGVIAFTPKIFWENFNVDGIEAFEFGRSLTTSYLPHWEIEDGIFGFYHNFFLFAYPNHWFIALFGPFEAAARLPFFLYLVVLFAALVLLIERNGVRALSAGEEAALWLGLVLYTVVHVYNTNYDSFFADIAEMTATDTLWISCFVAACYALWSNRTGWFWLFGLMTYSASPGGLLLLAALVPVTYFSTAPERTRQVRTLAKLIVVCLIIGVAYEILYSPYVVDQVNNQFSAKNMLRRLYPPTLTDFIRLNALLFPSGILPALSLLAVRRRDHSSWIIGGVTVIYFGAIYLQAWTSLHQFTPTMILPLVVFWRIYLNSSPTAQGWLLPSVVLTTLLSLYLSLPRHFQINMAIREFGQATSYKIGDYERSYGDAVRGGRSLSALLPSGYRLHYPEQPWGADPLSWIYYATREKPPGTTINYIVQPASEPLPGGFTAVSTQDGVSVFVRDQKLWQRHREIDLPRVVQSPLYEPIYRRTYQFFRAYSERMQKKENKREEVKGK